MDFILSLLLGGAWAGIKVRDDLASARYDRNYSQYRAQRMAWRNRVTDLDVERELKLFIERPETMQEILKEVAEVYDPILEGRRLDELYPRRLWCKPERKWTPRDHERYMERVCRLNRGNALRILMAKRGLITDFDADCQSGLSLTPLDRHVLSWCDDKLTELGVPIRLGHKDTGALIWEMLPM